MARKRMIDPTFWEDEQVGQLSIRQRLLLLSCFNHADDEGRGRAHPALLRNQTFVYDDDVTVSDVKQDMEEICKSLDLSNAFCLKTYNDGKQNEFYCIPNWSETNKPSHPTRSSIPNPPEGLLRPPENFANTSDENHEDSAKRSRDIIEDVLKGSGDTLEDFTSVSSAGQGRGGEVSQGQSRSGKVSLGDLRENSGKIPESFAAEIMKFLPNDWTDYNDFVDDAFQQFSAAAAAQKTTHAASYALTWWQRRFGEAKVGKNAKGEAIMEGLLKACREYPAPLVAAALLKTAKYGGGKAKSWKYVKKIMVEMSEGKGEPKDE